MPGPCFGEIDTVPSGVMVTPKEQVTAQQYDMQFGTNVIGKVYFSSSGSLIARIGLTTGPWLFTQLLLPALFAASDASSTHEKARIVTVSSSAGYLTPGLDFNAMTDGPERTKYSEFELYNKSKFVRVTSLLIGLYAEC